VARLTMRANTRKSQNRNESNALHLDFSTISLMHHLNSPGPDNPVACGSAQTSTPAGPTVYAVLRPGTI
jgi:hypothetical protein